MTASRTLIAAARTSSSGFKYQEIETVDADSMIADLADGGWTAWICGEVAVEVAPAQVASPEQIAREAARIEREAARNAYLIAAQDKAARLITDRQFKKVLARRNAAEAAWMAAG